jgi:hypothetical protein
MKIINREMESEVITTEKSQTSLFCQASFNSDGFITLRNYNIEDRNSDEIIILSAEETQAIINLFSNIGKMIRNNDLPF